MSQILKIKELCRVDFVNEDKYDEEIGKDLKAIRVVVYETEKETLIEALQDYEENFDSNNIIESYDYFDEGCLDSEVISAEFVEKYDEVTIEHENSK